LVCLSKVFEARFAVNKDKATQIARRLYDQFYGGRGFIEGYRMHKDAIFPECHLESSYKYARIKTTAKTIPP
jgi:hypothetical protein